MITDKDDYQWISIRFRYDNVNKKLSGKILQNGWDKENISCWLLSLTYNKDENIVIIY